MAISIFGISTFFITLEEFNRYCFTSYSLAVFTKVFHKPFNAYFLLDSVLSDDGAFTTTALVNINFLLFLATLRGRSSFSLFDGVQNDGFFIEDVRGSFTCSFSNEPLYKKGRRFLHRYIFNIFYEAKQA